MAENSLFAQRLHAITERRRLHERILATRRALEEERLRAQRLKRTSLRERWLMEGTPMPAEDQDRRPSLSPLGEAEERVRDLEQDLSSLQSQMQDLDNMDLSQQQQLQSLKEVMPLDGLVKIDGTSSNSPQKGNPTESKLELTSDGPQKPTEPAAKEQLENGDMSEEAGQGLPFGVPGNECSSGKTEVKANPVTVDGGDSQPRPGKTEGANSATKNLDLNEAPAAYQRKLAVEKMVIRDHLGQEVGSMDAVGQTQAFIRKEDDLEDRENFGNDCEEGSPSGGPCNVVDQKETGCAAENHLDCDLGSRDGPDGASPTSHDQPDPPNLRQDSANCLDPPGKQGGSEQERGPLAEEAVPMETGPNERPGRNAEEEEEEAGPARNLAACDAAAEEAAGNQANHAQKEEPQGCHGSEPIMPGGAEEGEETRPSVSGQIVLGQEATLLNPLEEARTDPAMTSSDQIPSPSDGKASLPGHNPLPFQETETRFLESEESLLSDQGPSVLLDQSLQEIKDPPLGRTPSSLPESCIASNPPSVQDHFSSPEQKAPSLQDEAAPPEEKGVLSNQAPSSVPETPGKNLDPISTALQESSDAAGDQLLPRSPDQLPALPGEAPSSSHEGQRSPHILPAAPDQEQPAFETKDPLPDRPPSVTNPLSPLSDQIMRLEDAGPSSSQEVQLPTVTETPNPVGQIPFPENEKEDTPTTGPDQNPLALLDQKPPFLDGEEATGPRTDHSPLRHPTPSCLPEGSLQDQARPTAVEHVLVSLQDQTSSLEGTEETLPGKTSPFLVDKTPTPLAQTPTPNEGQGPMLQQTTVLNALPTANQESAQPLLEADINSENQEPKEDRDATLASEAEAAEIQESMAAEQQPLLDGLKATVATQDIALGHPQQPKSGAPKHQGASIQEAPVYITTDGHPASGHLQPAGSHQEEGQEEGQSRRKQKTCQCCLVM